MPGRVAIPPRALAPRRITERADAVSLLVDGTRVPTALTGIPPDPDALADRLARPMTPTAVEEAGRPPGGR